MITFGAAPFTKTVFRFLDPRGAAPTAELAALLHPPSCGSASRDSAGGFSRMNRRPSMFSVSPRVARLLSRRPTPLRKLPPGKTSHFVSLRVDQSRLNCNLHQQVGSPGCDPVPQWLRVDIDAGHLPGTREVGERHRLQFARDTVADAVGDFFAAGLRKLTLFIRKCRQVV